MTEKHTVSLIKQELDKRKEVYKELGTALQQEAELARAESNSARSILEGKIAAVVAQQLPALDAPALATFQQIAVTYGHPQRPQDLRDRRMMETQAAKAQQAGIEKDYGSTETLADRLQTATQQADNAALSRDGLRRTLNGLNNDLEMVDDLNHLLRRKGAPQLSAETMAYYARPETRFKRIWRHVTDDAYREARSTINQYAAKGLSIPELLKERTDSKAALAEKEGTYSAHTAEATRTQQQIDRLSAAKAAQKSDHEILNEVRVAVTGMILSDPNIFRAVEAALPGTFDAEAKAMHSRMELFGGLAVNLGIHREDLTTVSGQLDKPLANLDKAIRNRRGGKEVEFDLPGKTAALDKHQLVMSQRVRAAQDIRNASHSRSATSGDYHDTSSNWLLWYLILSDPGHAHAATTPASGFNSGNGGDFGGGGAGGSWDAKAENSFFRAELLGVTPDTAASKGFSLNIPADVARELGSTPDLSGTSSFNTLGSVESGGPAFSGFNDLGKQMDLGNLTSEISSSVSSLNLDTGNLGGGYSSGGYSAPSYSYDGGGSSYSSDSGGGSCGGGGGGCD